MNIPNSITSLRLLLTLIFIICISIQSGTARHIALISFCLAAASDWVDGYLARKLNQVTSLGKLLDPLADKILTAAGFIYLTAIGFCPAWITCVIIGREFLVTGLRQIAIEQQFVLAADHLGKWKTTFQILYIVLCLAFLAFGWQWTSPQHLGIQAVLWVAATLTIVSGFNYLRQTKRLFIH